jgi:hypothetical protein
MVIGTFTKQNHDFYLVWEKISSSAKNNSCKIRGLAENDKKEFA